MPINISNALSYPIEGSDPNSTARVRFSNYKMRPAGSGTSTMSTRLNDNIGTNLNASASTNSQGYGGSYYGIDTERRFASEERQAENTANQLNTDALFSAFSNIFGNGGTALSNAGATVSGTNVFADWSTPIINMYVPLSVTYGDTIIYDNANIGAAGAAMAKALEGGSGMIGAMGKGLLDGTLNALDVMSNGTAGLNTDAARLATQRSLQTATGLIPGQMGTNINNTATLALQTSVNPNTRALFRGVNLREFTFAFQMIANSSREAQQIEAIIKHFRKKMYPEVYDPFQTNIPFAYNFPDLFKIDFKLGSMDLKLPKIEKCYLRNCQVSYNATGATYHKDGHANEVQMSLTFMEFKTLSSQDIEGGF